MMIKEHKPRNVKSIDSKNISILSVLQITEQNEIGTEN